jgi:hypothetical protein
LGSSLPQAASVIAAIAATTRMRFMFVFLGERDEI